MATKDKKSETLMHLDSVIFISKYLDDKSEYTCTAYLLKANFFYSNKNFDNALENYLLALESSKLVKNKPIEVKSKTYIGVIKLERTGSEQEAIDIFRQCMGFYNEGNNKREYLNDYLLLLHDFSEGFRRIQKLDSSHYYNIKGVKESQKFNKKFLKNYFIFSEGINQVLLKNYVAARDSLKNSYELINKSNDHTNKIISNYYLAESYKGLKQLDTATFYFAKTDSIYQKHKVYSNEVKKMYQNKMEIAKKNRNLKKELFCVNRMLELDSLKH